MNLFIKAPDGRKVALDDDNTMVFLFHGRDDLDHVGVQYGNDKVLLLCFEQEFIHACIEAELPVMLHHNWPQWAFDRVMACEVDDLDRLLEQEES